MRRGTTPPFAVEADGDFTNLNVHLSFEAEGVLIVKSDDQLTITYENGVTTIATRLTQQDTLSFREGTDCEIQVRAFNSDGSLAVATTVGHVPVERILEDGFLPASNEDDNEN